MHSCFDRIGGAFLFRCGRGCMIFVLILIALMYLRFDGDAFLF